MLIGFDVELQGKTAGVVVKGLIVVMRVAGEAAGAFRQIERIAMPMQHLGALAGELGQRGAEAFGRQRDLAPADLFHRPLVNSGAERGGHELCAEADAEHGLATRQAPLDQLDLGRQEAIGGDIADPDRPAEHHDEIGIANRAVGKLVRAGLAVGDIPAAPIEHPGEIAEILEGDMADCDDGAPPSRTVSKPAPHEITTVMFF